MDPRRVGRRDLALLATAAVGLSRFADGPWLWVAAILVFVGVALGALEVLGEGEPRGVPNQSLLLPATAAAAAVGAIRLLPLGLLTILALGLVFVVLERTLALEARLEALTSPPRQEDRTRVLAWVVVVAFEAFSGVAGTIPGGLVEPGQSGLGQGGAPLVGTALLVLVVADAVVAFLLGYRVSALRLSTVRDAGWSALTYASSSRSLLEACGSWPCLDSSGRRS